MNDRDTAPAGAESANGHPIDHFPEHSDEELPSFVSLYETPDENLCEFGDVVLVADDGFHPRLKIRVSSCVMACFRKVFRTLFSSRFAEGQSLRAGVSEIKLADNPTSLLVLCHYLHRQGHLSGKLASSNALLDYALIVDKYNCVNALKPEHDTLSDFLDISEAWDGGHKRASLLAAA